MGGMDAELTGQCLCGAVAFGVAGKISELYKCHCSLCRRYTGTSNSAMFATAKRNLTWQRGADNVTTYTAPTGFTGVFCRTCGSPLPKTRWDKIYLVPAGTLDEVPAFSQLVHLHTLSKAAWDVIGDDSPQFEGDLPSGKRVSG